jgi:hypothetical protein
VDAQDTVASVWPSMDAQIAMRTNGFVNGTLVCVQCPVLILLATTNAPLTTPSNTLWLVSITVAATVYAGGEGYKDVIGITRAPEDPNVAAKDNDAFVSTVTN